MLSIYNQKGEKYQMKIYKSFFEITNLLQDETQYREYLEQARWGGEPVCPHCHCQSSKHYQLKTKGELKGLYKCRQCRKRFTVTTKTMFDGTQHIFL